MHYKYIFNALIRYYNLWTCCSVVSECTFAKKHHRRLLIFIRCIIGNLNNWWKRKMPVNNCSPPYESYRRIFFTDRCCVEVDQLFVNEVSSGCIFTQIPVWATMLTRRPSRKGVLNIIFFNRIGSILRLTRVATRYSFWP